ncbi:hypothetical protein [Pedobacter jeongneungensis]|uniref:hypothetical protein n=1 Tax=Pedobacter jeongneungensis TaxID=947309 RepID=UPI0031D994AB
MKSLAFLVFIFLASTVAFAQGTVTGCKVSGGNLIYTSSTQYLLGVDLGGGLSLALGSYVYNLNPNISTNVSCTVSWASNVSVQSSGGCVYGSPSVSLPGLAAVCTNCVYGDLVTYTPTLQCNLDDYSWTFGAAASIFGIFVIRRRNKP